MNVAWSLIIIGSGFTYVAVAAFMSCLELYGEAPLSVKVWTTFSLIILCSGILLLGVIG